MIPMTPIDLVVVACCIAADVVTGLVSAWLTHSFESGKMREGAGHKLGELFALGLTYGLQYGLRKCLREYHQDGPGAQRSVR